MEDVKKILSVILGLTFGYLFITPLLKFSLINHSGGIIEDLFFEYPAVLLILIICLIKYYKTLDDSKEDIKRMLSLALGFMVLYDFFAYAIVLFLFSRSVALSSKLICIICAAAIVFFAYKFLYKRNYKKVSYVIFVVVLLLFPGGSLIVLR